MGDAATALLERWMFWASGVAFKSEYGEKVVADTDAFLASVGGEGSPLPGSDEGAAGTGPKSDSRAAPEGPRMEPGQRCTGIENHVEGMHEYVARVVAVWALRHDTGRCPYVEPSPSGGGGEVKLKPKLRRRMVTCARVAEPHLETYLCDKPKPVRRPAPKKRKRP